MLHCNKEQGFTLIEVLVALFILVVGILSLHLMQLSAIKGNSSANLMSLKTAYVSDQIERIFGLSYNDASLKDVDEDGTDQDTNGDGVDNNGGNFGLDDAQCLQDGKDPAGNPVAGCLNKADSGRLLQNDYFVYWNIANDVPIKGTKTVKFIIHHRNIEPKKVIAVEYIKFDLI